MYFFSFDDEQDSFCDSSGIEVEEKTMNCSETDAVQNTAIYVETGNKYQILNIFTTLWSIICNLKNFLVNVFYSVQKYNNQLKCINLGI